MGTGLSIVIVGAALYVLFLWWYAARGRLLDTQEKQRYLAEFSSLCRTEQGREVLQQVEEFIATDDGCAFMMQNLVRYRPKALYPPGYTPDDDPRKADLRHDRAIIWPLPRYVTRTTRFFIARRSGRFIDPEGADQ